MHRLVDSRLDVIQILDMRRHHLLSISTSITDIMILKVSHNDLIDLTFNKKSRSHSD